MKYQIVKHSASSSRVKASSIRFDDFGDAQNELKSWFYNETDANFNDLCWENSLDKYNDIVYFPPDFHRYDWDNYIIEICEVDDTVDQIAEKLNVTSTEARAIAELYDRMYGASNWEIKQVESDYQQDYLSIHEYDSHEFVHYLCAGNEFGIWIDSLKEMTKEEIEQYL